MTTTRSNRADVRNPMLALAAVQRLAALIRRQPHPVQTAFQEALTECSEDFRARGNEAWRKHKPPMAAYWKEQAVVYRHARLALRAPAPSTGALDRIGELLGELTGDDLAELEEMVRQHIDDICALKAATQ